MIAVQQARRKQVAYPEYLAYLLGVETQARRERYLTTRAKLAHFRFHRGLDDFDFKFQPSTDQRQIQELAGFSFIADAANVILLGPPCVGKTHLAVGLGIKAIGQGFGVYFVRAFDLLEDLRRAQAELA